MQAPPHKPSSAPPVIGASPPIIEPPPVLSVCQTTIRRRWRPFIIGLTVFFALTPLVVWLLNNLGLPWPITIILLAIIAINGLARYFAKRKLRDIQFANDLAVAERKRKFRAIQIANIDTMSGIEFESYLQKLLGHQGYSVSVTRATGDFGVDLVASRGTDKSAVQVKRSRSKISRRAVSDAVAGMQHYHCSRAMVITNSYFTRGAVTLARSTNCILVNRDLLAQWIIELQNTQTRNDPASHLRQGTPPLLNSTKP